MTNQAAVAMAVQSSVPLAATKKIVRRADHLSARLRTRKAMLPIAMELWRSCIPSATCMIFMLTL